MPGSGVDIFDENGNKVDSFGDQSAVCQSGSEEIWEAVEGLGISPISRAEEQRLKDRINYDIAEYRKTKEYSSGSMNKILTSITEALKPPKVRWSAILSRTLRKSMEASIRGRDDYSMSRPNRRYMSYDFIAPSFVAYIPKIRYIIDTSGSMIGNHCFERVLSECNGILKNIKGKIQVSTIDSQEQGEPIYTNSIKDVQNNLSGGGGTDMSVALDRYAQESKKDRPDLMIVATDGYWNWPQFLDKLRDPRCKGLDVIILITDEGFLLEKHVVPAELKSRMKVISCV